MCMCIYVCIYMYIYVYIYTGKQPQYLRGNCWSRQTSPTRAASPRRSPGPPFLPPCTSFYGVGVREREREREREGERQEVTSPLPSTRSYTRLCWGYVIKGRGGSKRRGATAGPARHPRPARRVRDAARVRDPNNPVHLINPETLTLKSSPGASRQTE